MPTVGALSVAECWRRLKDEYTVQLAFCHDGDVHVIPVNISVHAEQVWLRAAEGVKLRAARAGVRMAVSVHRHQELEHGGWSVTARGPSAVVDEGPETHGAPAVRPWALEARDGQWVRIAVDTLTGRQLQPRGAAVRGVD